MESRQGSGYWMVRLGMLIPFLLVVGGLLWVWLASTPAPDTSLQPVSAIAMEGVENDATLSPQGDRIVYSWSEPGQDSFDLYVKRVGSGDSQRLTDAAGSELFPAWSPDGAMIAFVQESSEGACSINRIPAIGGPWETIADCSGAPRDLAWSPDGRQLALSALDETGQTRRIYALDLQVRELRPLTQPPAGSRGDRYPTFSPDGRQMAFRRAANAGQDDIFVHSMLGGPLKRISYDKSTHIRGLDWTPDGREIIFASDRAGRFSLWRIDVEGGALHRFPVRGHRLTQPRTARQKERLIYKRTLDVTDLFRLGLDEQGAVVGDWQRIASSSRSELHPQLSPDGQRVAFTSDRTGAFEVWSCRLDGTGLVQHTQIEDALVNSPRWSPDGAVLVFEAQRHGHGDLYLVAADGHSPRRITLEPSDEVNAAFSRDGRWIYFASNRRSGWQIWKMPASGGPAIQVTRRGGFLAQEGREGKYLYFSRLDDPGLWRLTLQGGEEERIIDTLSAEDWGSWAVRRRGIYFVQRDPEAVAFFGFDDGRIRQIVQPPNPIPSFNPVLDVSENEDLLICGLIQKREAEVMMVGF